MFNFDKTTISPSKYEIKDKKLEGKKQEENLRKEQYFNAKSWLSEDEKEALLKQIEEKKKREKHDHELLGNKVKKILADMDLGNAVQPKNENKEHEPQGQEQFDLYNTKSIIKQLQMPFEEIIGPRKFTKGTYLNIPSEDFDSKKVKEVENRLWQCLAKQIDEKLSNENNFKIFNLQSGKDVEQEDNLLNKANINAEMVRMDAAKSTMSYNLNKSDNEGEKKIQERLEIDKEEQTCGNTFFNSNMFIGNTEARNSSPENGALKTSHIRGLTQELKIQEIPKKQIEEMSRNKVTEKYFKEAAELQSSCTKTVAKLLESKEKN